MNRFALKLFLPDSPIRRGYTLIEILIATTLSLMILGAVVHLFGIVGTSITQSRSIMEASERLRAAQTRLQLDLEGLTVTVMPPRRPEFNEGYLEIKEGMVGQGQYYPSMITDSLKDQPASTTPPYTPNPNASTAIPRPFNSEKNITDTTVGDFDDILMFTTHTTGKPFVGRFNDPSTGMRMIESDVAEVAWFLRGRDLHRRVLLVAPGVMTNPATPQGFFLNNDISVHLQNGQFVANTLSALTRRECRYAHAGTIPCDIRVWGQCGLPTLRECSFYNISKSTYWNWTVPTPAQANLNTTDFWTNDASKRISDDYLISLQPGLKSPGDNIAERVADDVILTNVIAFDVKVWDPGVGQYVDLGFNPGANTSFSGFGNTNSNLAAIATTARIYDTWSTTYMTGIASNGFDDASTGIVDSDTEITPTYYQYCPPYPAPLRGIQVKIRIFEPDSRQIREVTISQDFLPK